MFQWAEWCNMAQSPANAKNQKHEKKHGIMQQRLCAEAARTIRVKHRRLQLQRNIQSESKGEMGFRSWQMQIGRSKQRGRGRVVVCMVWRLQQEKASAACNAGPPQLKCNDELGRRNLVSIYNRFCLSCCLEDAMAALLNESAAPLTHKKRDGVAGI